MIKSIFKQNPDFTIIELDNEKMLSANTPIIADAKSRFSTELEKVEPISNLRTDRVEPENWSPNLDSLGQIDKKDGKFYLVVVSDEEEYLISPQELRTLWP